MRKGGGIIARFYSNIKQNPQDNVRFTVSQLSHAIIIRVCEYSLPNKLLASLLYLICKQLTGSMSQRICILVLKIYATITTSLGPGHPYSVTAFLAQMTCSYESFDQFKSPEYKQTCIVPTTTALETCTLQTHRAKSVHDKVRLTN